MGNERNPKPVNPRDAAFIARLRATAATPSSPLVTEPSIPPENEDAPQRDRMIKATFEAANQTIGTVPFLEEIRDKMLPGWSVEAISTTGDSHPLSYRTSHVEGGEIDFSFFGAVLKSPTKDKIIAVGFATDSFSNYIHGPDAVEKGHFVASHGTSFGDLVYNDSNTPDGPKRDLSFGVSYAQGAPDSGAATLVEAVNAIRRIGFESDREPEPRYRYFNTTSRVALGEKSSQNIRSSADNSGEDQGIFDPGTGTLLTHTYKGEKTYEEALRKVMEDGLAKIFDLKPDLATQNVPQEVTPHIIDVILRTFDHFNSLGKRSEVPFGEIGNQYRAATSRGYGKYLSSRPTLHEHVSKYWIGVAERIRSYRSNRLPVVPGGGRYYTPPSPTFMGQPVIHIERPFDPDSAD